MRYEYDVETVFRFFENQGITDTGQLVLLSEICDVLYNRLGPFTVDVVRLGGLSRGQTFEVTLTAGEQQVTGYDYRFEMSFLRAAFEMVRENRKETAS